MEFKELNPNKEVLLNQIYFQGIQENEKNAKVWKDYKEKHEKVKEGLKAILPEVSLNCMVPLGKRALMKGQLVHTNEILVCIGDGYFVKYSNAQAVELCNRRINRAEEMIKKYEKERNLFELRKILPQTYGAFAGDECKDILEFWDDAQVEKWRADHREKVKEYQDKLREIKNMKAEKIETEDDLFKRLDELELEEELADELNRLQDYNYLDETSDDAEESEEEVSEEIENEKTIEIENEIDSKQKEVYLGQTHCEQVNIVNTTTVNEHLNHGNEFQNNGLENKAVDKKICDSVHSEVPEVIKQTELPLKDTKINGKFEVSIISEDEIKKMLGAPSTSTNIYNSKLFDKKSKKSMHTYLTETEHVDEYKTHSEKPTVPNRRVSFATPHFIELKSPFGQNNDSEEERDHDQNIRTEDSLVENEMDESIIIDFKHSEIEPSNSEGTNNEILSPQDIYRIFCKPKSILKRTQHINYINTNIPLLDESIEEEPIPESEMDSVARSTYNLVVQDIQERNTHLLHSEPSQLNNTKRRVSKFKLERENIKKLDT